MRGSSLIPGLPDGAANTRVSILSDKVAHSTFPASGTAIAGTQAGRSPARRTKADPMMTSDPPDARALLARIETERAAIMDEARAPAIARQHARGKRSARERIAMLADPGSFREIGSLVSGEGEHQATRAQAPADGVVIGTVLLDGRPAVVLSQDFTVFGGSIGVLGSAKGRRALQLAITRGIPFVMLLDGGGHRIQGGQDSRHFAHANGMFHDFARASGWVPMVCVMLGAGFAGPTNYAGLADLVVMVRGLATMGLAGPALVKAGVGEVIEQEALGGAAVQVDQHGLADLGVDDEAQALAAARRFLAFLPANARAATAARPADDPPTRREEALLDLVPANPRKAYDMRRVIGLIADRDSVFEIKPTYAGNILTTLARLDGRPVGFVANQPMKLGGMIDANACDKMAHFIALCDAYGLPIVTLIDVPGFAIGSGAERTKVGRRSAKLIHEWGNATVPRVSVVLRKGYGLGYFAMAGGRAFAADASLAWPTAQICAMSVEGSVDVAFRKDYEAAPDPQARRQELIDGIRAKIGPLRAAEGFGIDEIIDPRDTRRVLIETLAQCPSRRPPDHPPKFRSIAPI
jgi:acetyl-CoA carboxylase carboxyltransferase component